MDHSKKISKSKAHELLKIKMEEMKWPAECMRTVQQIAGHYSQFAKIMNKKSRDNKNSLKYTWPTLKMTAGRTKTKPNPS